MTRRAFDLEQLEHYLDVHGSALERWPADARAAAQQLLEQSAEAREALSRAERLTALLDAAPDVLPSAALQARIAALPVRHPQGWAAWWPFGNPLAPLFAWAAAAALGVVVGSSSLPGFELEGPEEAALFGELDGEGEVAELAASDDWSDLELALGLDAVWEEEP